MNLSVKSTVDVVKSHRLFLLKLLLAIQVGFLGYFLFTAIHDGHYFLAHEDEVINFSSAKLFSETGSLRAEGCIAEDVSRMGQMNWYGPGYSLLYGSLRNMFGDHVVLFIQLHGVFALITLVLIYFLPSSTENRLLMASAIVFTNAFTAYIFTYFPESLHFLLAMILILLLLRIHQSKNDGHRRLYVMGFIVLIMVSILLRVTYVFWLAALIGLSDSRRKALKMTILFAIVLILTLVYMKLFTAPPYAGEMQKIDRLYEFDVFGFVWKTVKALLRNSYYLIISGAAGVYFLLTLFGVGAVIWWKTRDRFLLASVLVSFFLLGSLMAYYSAGPWYFLKQSAVLVPLLITALMRSEIAARLKYGVLFASAGVFLFTAKELTHNIAEHREAYVKFQEFQDFRSSLNELSDQIKGSKPVTVLWCYDEYDFGGATEALMPFSTREGFPILYTSNVLSADSVPHVKFRFHHKLIIDYLLSREPVSFPFAKEVHTTPYYHFYKIEED